MCLHGAIVARRVALDVLVCTKYPIGGHRWLHIWLWSVAFHAFTFLSAHGGMVVVCLLQVCRNSEYNWRIGIWTLQSCRGSRLVCLARDQFTMCRKLIGKCNCGKYSLLWSVIHYLLTRHSVIPVSFDHSPSIAHLEPFNVCPEE